MSFDNQSERMTSIVIDPDHDIDIENPNLNAPIRGILKNPEDNNFSEKELKLRMIKMCLLIIFVICYVPFIVADLYYGMSNTICVNERPNKLNINLKIYLLVSGFLILFNLILTILLILYLPLEATEEEYGLIICISSIFGKIMTIIQFVWNLLGLIIIWAFMYEKEICDSEISTYLFISVILKILANIGIASYRLA